MFTEAQAQEILSLFEPSSRTKVANALESNGEARELALNLLISRNNLFAKMIDPRRDVDKECGYLDTEELNPETYYRMYERESVAARVVELYPKEAWKTQPVIYEDENEDTETDWEIARAEVSRKLRGPRTWSDRNQGDPIWNYLQRLDILAGIGHYGILLFGLDDKKPLNEPVDGINEDGSIVEPTGKTNRNLLYLRVFDESKVRISRYQETRENPRYGLPVNYQVTVFATDTDVPSVSSQSGRTVDIHWSRVLHYAPDMRSNEIFGTPRLRPVFNKVANCIKLYGGSTEGYWRGAFPGLSIESHPQLGPDPRVNTTKLRDQLYKYQNSLQRLLVLLGMSAKSLAPQVEDPTAQIKIQLESICLYLGCPMRVFLGSERGELASGQDEDTWEDRVVEYRNSQLIPNMIIPFEDRLIIYGVVPPPEQYFAAWPETKDLGEEAQAKIAVTKTEALAKYVQGNVDNLIQPLDYLTRILRFTKEEAEAILENTLEYLEQQNPDAENVVAGRNPEPSELEGEDEVVGGGGVVDEEEPVVNEDWINYYLGNNCGTGDGGFKPGNKCAVGGSSGRVGGGKGARTPEELEKLKKAREGYLAKAAEVKRRQAAETKANRAPFELARVYDKAHTLNRDELRKEILPPGAGLFSERNQKVAKVLEEREVSIGVHKIHGMSEGQEMVAVNVDGLAIAYPPSLRSVVADDIRIFTEQKDNIPRKLWKSVDEITYTHQKNRHDEYWGNKFNIPKFESAATGGNGSICVYRGKSHGMYVFTHEAGHTLASKIWGDTTPAPSSPFAKAQKKEKPVSDYASHNRAEDFAESVRLYVQGPTLFSESFPKKAKALKSIFGGGK